MRFSVVIPCWNEGAAIGANLKRLREISESSSMEVILVDGGSSDNTVAAARTWADRVVALDKPNRGAQLHAGAQKAGGDLLFFLHADTQPPNGWQRSLEKFWLQTADEDEPLAATAFSVDYGSAFSLRLVAWAQNTRTRLRQIAYGDQGICTSGEGYVKSGGFPPIPLMEDVEFSRRLRRFGRVELLPERIMPAARRLRSRGVLLNALFNRWIVLRYALGADPQTLWKRYYAGSRHEVAPAPTPSNLPHPFANRFKKRSRA